MTELNWMQQLRFPYGSEHPPVMTQAELATRLADITGEAWDQSRVSRVESNPDDAPTRVTVAIFEVYGLQHPLRDMIYPTFPPTGVDAGTPLERLRTDLGALRDWVTRSAPEALEGCDDFSEELQRFARLCDQLEEKPRLAFFGKFDAGKSTIVNALLGGDSMPTSYAPATRVVTYVRHLEDKPGWLSEDVLMLDDDFDPVLWSDEGHCLSHKVVAGGLETLKDHGTHRGSRAKDSEATFALVFVDAPILNACNIIDMPGTENDTTDTKKAESREVTFEAAVFADPSQGFLNQGALLRLGRVVRRLPAIEQASPAIPPLANLFIVATHAEGGISDRQLRDEILGTGAEGAWRHLGATALAKRGERTGRTISELALAERFFCFDRRIRSRRESALDAIADFMRATQPFVSWNNANIAIEDFRTASSEKVANEIRFFTETIGDQAAAKEHLAYLDAQDEDRIRTTDYARKTVESRIAQYRAEMRLDVATLIDRHTETEEIERLITRHFSGRKDAQQNAAALVLEQIQDEIERMVEVRAGQVSELINEFLGEYDRASVFQPNSIGEVRTPFNSKGAFAGGLTGLAAIGGLALWASTLGNLGAYILVAQAVSAVSALGITTGGTAVWISTVAAIGGPITLAIGIVVIATVLGWALLRGSWESRLAQKLSNLLRDSELKQQYVQGVSKFWDDTLTAFEAGAANVEKEWISDVERLRRMANTTDTDQLTHCLNYWKQVQIHIDGMAWHHKPSPTKDGIPN